MTMSNLSPERNATELPSGTFLEMAEEIFLTSSA